MSPLLRTAAATEASVTTTTIDHRRLLDFSVDEKIENVEQALRRLFSTPPDDWSLGQWFLAALLLFLLLWCCGCVSGGRRYYGRGGYRSSSSGGGLCACLQNLLLCLCCYELCCAGARYNNSAAYKPEGADNEYEPDSDYVRGHMV
jgi:hypothetical protein